MKYHAVATLVLALASCAPPPDRGGAETPASDVAPAAPAPTPVGPWEEIFARTHGTPYDPLSRIDREKMAALQGRVDVFQSGNARARVLDVARALIGQTETHGPNRSPTIDAMNRLTGVPMGSPYCASFNAWVYDQAKVPPGWPRSAWSPDWVRSPTWTRANGGRLPEPADAFGIWFASQGRVAHTGLIERWGTTSAVTIEANTSPSAEFGGAADRDGDGVWRKRRLNSQIYAVRNWIKEEG